MDVLYDTCCGLDVHKREVVACLLCTSMDGRSAREVRTFSTTTDSLLALAEWLTEAGCRCAAMESTGVYWKPVYNLLEGKVPLVVVNAAHIKAVPGRKTDVKDAEWIADLLRHGLLRASFIPDQAQRELRDLTRTRTVLTDERSAAVNRLQKVLEDANIKLAGVATDIMGVSARAMLGAILQGEADPQTMAELAKGRLRKKKEQLVRALSGRVSEHHRLLLATHLEHIDFLEESIQRLSKEIEERLRPFEDELARLDTIPGVGPRIAQVLAAEMGLDMTRFPSPQHLASWAGMCPGNDQSAGKRKGGKTRKANKWIRRALTEAGKAASKTKGVYLALQYRRIAARRGFNKATVAVGHTILCIAYYLLSRKEEYRDSGTQHWDERHKARARQRAVDQLNMLGYQVTIAPKPAPA